MWLGLDHTRKRSNNPCEGFPTIYGLGCMLLQNSCPWDISLLLGPQLQKLHRIWRLQWPGPLPLPLCQAIYSHRHLHCPIWIPVPYPVTLPANPTPTHKGWMLKAREPLTSCLPHNKYSVSVKSGLLNLPDVRNPGCLFLSGDTVKKSRIRMLYSCSTSEESNYLDYSFFMETSIRGLESIPFSSRKLTIST